MIAPDVEYYESLMWLSESSEAMSPNFNQNMELQEFELPDDLSAWDLPRHNVFIAFNGIFFEVESSCHSAAEFFPLSRMILCDLPYMVLNLLIIYLQAQVSS